MEHIKWAIKLINRSLKYIVLLTTVKFVEINSRKLTGKKLIYLEIKKYTFPLIVGK